MILSIETGQESITALLILATKLHEGHEGEEN